MKESNRTVEQLRDLLRRAGHGATLVSGREEPFARPAPPKHTENLHDHIKPGSLSAVSGSWSCGKTSFALEAAARATQAGERAAVVDGRGWIYPPALALAGIDLERLLLVHTPVERTVWAAEQVLRSGAFRVVVVIESHALAQAKLRRLQLAAERSGSAAILVCESLSVGAGLVATRFAAHCHGPPQQALRASPKERCPVSSPPRRKSVEIFLRGGQRIASGSNNKVKVL